MQAITACEMMNADCNAYCERYASSRENASTITVNNARNTFAHSSTKIHGEKKRGKAR